MHRPQFRAFDGSHSAYVDNSTIEATAADQIIEEPSSHLLTQDEVFAAEGGFVGLTVQGLSVAGGLSALFARCPTLTFNLRNGMLRPHQFMWLGATTFFSYQLGYYLGMELAGDSAKRHNHQMAYVYQKTLNRMEGRNILTKKPMY